MAEGRSTRTGGCLCGAVRLEIVGEPIYVGHCCCEDCQRFTGGGHASAAVFQVDQVTRTGGLREFGVTTERGSEAFRLFCTICGSGILSRNSTYPDVVAISLGVLDETDDLTPQSVIYARSRRRWDAFDADLPLFETQPDAGEA
ncbi:MAG: GFA family protein [Pseudomonadota bacterium]